MTIHAAQIARGLPSRYLQRKRLPMSAPREQLANHEEPARATAYEFVFNTDLFISDNVESGRFSSRDEVIDELILLFERTTEELLAMKAEGGKCDCEVNALTIVDGCEHTKTV